MTTSHPQSRKGASPQKTVHPSQAKGIPGNEIPPEGCPIKGMPYEVLENIFAQAPAGSLRALSQKSNRFRNHTRAKILDHLRRHLNFWLEKDFGFLICCILCHDDPNETPDSIEEGKRHLNAVADAICNSTDKPLRFEVPVDSPVYMGLLVKIISAVHK